MIGRSGETRMRSLARSLLFPYSLVTRDLSMGTSYALKKYYIFNKNSSHHGFFTACKLLGRSGGSSTVTGTFVTPAGQV